MDSDNDEEDDDEEIIGTLYEKELQKVNQQGFRIEKVIKKMEIKYTLNEKDMIWYNQI